jgi:hypothetical protein
MDKLFFFVPLLSQLAPGIFILLFASPIPPCVGIDTKVEQKVKDSLTAQRICAANATGRLR